MSGDPTIDQSHVGDSSTPRSDQAAMSGNTKDLAWSLVDMKISSGDPPMEDATPSHQREAQDPEGGAGQRGQDAEELHKYPMNVELHSTVPQKDAAEQARVPAEADGDAEGPKRDAADPEGFPRLEEGETERGVGDPQQARSIPSSGDIPMLEANPADPLDPLVTDKGAADIFPILPIVIPSSPPPQSIFPEETRQSHLKVPVMNEEVVDDTLQDLDAFSPEKKTADCDPEEEDPDIDIYEGLPDKAMTEVSTELDPVVEDLKSGHRRDVEKLVLQKGLKQLQRSLEPALPLGTASGPPITRSKGKEGPSTGTRVKEGTERKVKGKGTVAGTKTSCHSVSIRDQVREHMFQQRNYQPPSRSAKHLEAVRQAHEFVYKDYVGSIPFTNNFEIKPLPDADV